MTPEEEYRQAVMDTNRAYNTLMFELGKLDGMVKRLQDLADKRLYETKHAFDGSIHS